MSTRGMLYVLLGLVLIAIAVLLCFTWPALFWDTFKVLVLGAIPPFIVLLGLIFILVGRELGKLDEFQKSLEGQLKQMEEKPEAPKVGSAPVVAPKKKAVKKRKRK